MQKQIILVSCVGKKKKEAAPAAELYTSTWFTLARAYAEQSGHQWFILSAKHGLIPPSQVIKPYEATLKRMTRTNRQEWANQVFASIQSKLEPSAKIVILAGLPYREFLTDLLTQAGYTVEIPLANLGIGQQQAWLKSQLGQVEPEPQPPAEPPAPTQKVFQEYPTDQGLSLVPLDLIDQNPYQPRLELNPVETQKLARSIRLQKKTLPNTLGLLQVPVARPGSDGRVQLAFGHRRLAAFKYNDKFHGDEWDTWAAMPIKLVQMTDEEMYKTATIENDQRVNLNAIERAKSIEQGREAFGWTYEEAGKVHGLKKSAAKNLTDLLKLPLDIQELIAKGQLAQQSGRHLVRLMKEEPPLEQDCIELGCYIAFNGLSTSQADERVRQALKENYELKQLKAEVAALPCLRCNKKALFTKGPFHISLITCEACNAKYHGLGDYRDCKAEIEAEKTRARHRETRYCPNCNNSRLFTGDEMHREISITCDQCNRQARPNLWLTEPKPKEEYKPNVYVSGTCPKCGYTRDFNPTRPIVCPKCGKESSKDAWLQQPAKPEPQPNPQPPTPNPLKCHLCNGIINRREGGGLKCNDCGLEWSNLRRFREAKTEFSKETETITGQRANEAETKKPTIQEIWDTNNRKLAYEIVPDPWLPEPCGECGRMPLNLEPAQEAFLEQILKINDSDLATLDRIIEIMSYATPAQLLQLQKITTNGEKFLQAINK